MRIGHFIETGVPGGAEKLMLDICSYLKGDDITPVIIHFDHPFFIEKCAELDIEQCSLPFQRLFKKTLTLPLFALQFSKFLKEQQIDLLHSHLFGPVTGAALACRLAGIPSVGTLHDVYMVEEKPSRSYLLDLAALLGTQLAVVSRTMEDFYRQRLRFSAGRLNTIYNGVRVPGDLTQELRLEKRHELNVAENETLFISVGRLVQLKRIDRLLEAASLMGSEHLFKLVVVGDGPEEKKIARQLREKQLGDRIVMTGRRHDVESLLLASDCYIQCSETEGLSMSIMEAMSCGLPCLVTDVGGNTELVLDGINGKIVDGDPKDIAAKMKTITGRPDLCKSMGEKSKELVQQKFLLDTTVKMYSDLYRQAQ